MNRLVMKFGGSSLDGADRMNQVADLVVARLSGAPLVVLSAMGKTTNALFDMARLAEEGDLEGAMIRHFEVNAHHRRVMDALFDGQPLYREGQAPSSAERAGYLEAIWRPYHDTLRQELARLKAQFGYALLWDAHSIRSHVPHLFDGKLPDFNLGTFNGASCDPQLAERLQAVCGEAHGYSHVLNGRFKGGHITRHYGDPANDIHAVQLELAQSTYMEEVEPFRYREDLAQPTQVVLRQLLEEVLAWGQRRYC